MRVECIEYRKITSIALYLKFISLDHKDLLIRSELTNEPMFQTTQTGKNISINDFLTCNYFFSVHDNGSKLIQSSEALSVELSSSIYRMMNKF